MMWNLKDIQSSMIKRGKKPFKSVPWYLVLRFTFTVGFVVFAALFIHDVVIIPYRINQSIQKTEAIYASSKEAISPKKATSSWEAISSEEVNSTQEISSAPQAESTTGNITAPPAPTLDPTRDRQGRLLQFNDLLAINDDIKGWITIPDSNINYVVLQSSREDPEYYLTRDMEGKELKAGSLFLDVKGSVENSSKNLTIHGHNMTSTDNMFHYLIKYKDLDYYRKRPVFTFDTIYQKGQWKIFAVFITNGSAEKEALFDYTQADFENASDFMNFVYQLRIRSIYQIASVDVNENDQLLTLSTCSYEVKNYRTVIAARRVRDGEDPTVEVDGVVINPQPLYPHSYYDRYGGKAPELTETFEEALAKGEINWYQAPLESVE